MGLRRTIVLLSLALLIPLPVHAQQGWTGTVSTLKETPEADDYPATIIPAVAVDPAGNAVAAWKWGDILVSRSPAGSHTWLTPVALGPAFGGDPQVVVDAASNVTVVWAGSGRIFASRYTAGTDQWSPAIEIGQGFSPIAVGSALDVAVVWVSSDEGWRSLHSARFDSDAAAWQPAAVIASSIGSSEPAAAVDQAGNITVVFDEIRGVNQHGVSAVRYVRVASSWGPVVAVSATEPLAAALITIAVDAAGNVAAVWMLSVLQAARYVVATGDWTPPTNLTSSGGVRYVVLGSDPAGNTVVLWRTEDIGTVLSARYSVETGLWTATGVLPSAGGHFFYLTVDPTGIATVLTAGAAGGSHLYRTTVADPQWSSPTIVDEGGHWKGLAGDAQGNVFAYGFTPTGPCTWGHIASPECGWVWAIRWSASNQAWGPVTRFTGIYPVIGINPAGNAAAVWSEWHTTRACFGPCDGPLHIVLGVWRVQGTHWLATPAAPQIASIAPLDSALSVAFTPPLTTESAFAPITYDYSLDDGLTWIARVPPSLESPLLIEGLTPGVRRTVRLRAVNAAGAGLPSEAVANTPGPIPEPPTGLRVTGIAGARVTIAWMAPQYGVPPGGYAVEGGLQPGEASASIPLPASPCEYSFDAPADSFYVRMHSVSGSARSAASSEIRVYVVTPGPPEGLTATADGNFVTLTWAAPPNSVVPTGYLVEAGLAAGETAATLTSTGPSLSVTAPDGVYYVRVRSVANARVGSPSNEILLAVNRPVPSAPASLLGLVDNSTIALSWMNTAAGGSPASLRLTVTGSIATTLVLPVSEAFSVGGVPPGTYAFTIAAVNAAGASPPSDAVTLSVPGACSGAPQPPTGVAATVAGAMVDLSWNAPTAGTAVTGYTIMVSGSYTAVIPTSARRLTGAVAPGSYTVSVVSTNACGTSVPTAPVEITVPP